MIAPPDADGALLFFPWDGGGAAYKDEARLHAALAAEHRLILVSMRQPAGDCWWAPEGLDNVRVVDELLRAELIDARGIDPNRVFLTGLSGGADFASAFHFHTGYVYGGGVIARCGGDIPRTNGGDCAKEESPPPAPPRPIPAQRPRLRFDFILTADDPLLPASEAAAAFYADAGFEVRHRVVPGSGHCGFAEGWEAMDSFAEGLRFVAGP